MPTGVLPIQTIRELMQSGFIKGVPEDKINPASLDLPLSDEVYRLENTFLPNKKKKETVRSKIAAAGGRRYSLKNQFEVGVPYLVRVRGEFRLPKNVYAYVNPKSSTGRLDILSRIVADQADMYDTLEPPGWSGEMWVLVIARSFPVLLAEGLALSQARFFDGKSFLDELDLRLLVEKYGLFRHANGKRFADDEVPFRRDSFNLTIGLEGRFAGWECRGVNKVLDLTKHGFYQPEDFFTPVRANGGRITLKKGSFYILTTYEHVVVPPNCAAELRAIDPRFGEFRSHSAGYIDPGWGIADDNVISGQPITLEINPHEDITLEQGQTIARIRYERVKEIPEVLYSSAKSNYTRQVRGAKLSKHFKT